MSNWAEIKTKIDRAIVAESALTWLRQYGPKHACGRDTISASVSQNHASACGGAKQAVTYLEAAIQNAFPELNAAAIVLAEADIKDATAALPSADGNST